MAGRIKDALQFQHKDRAQAKCQRRAAAILPRNRSAADDAIRGEISSCRRQYRLNARSGHAFVKTGMFRS